MIDAANGCFHKLNYFLGQGESEVTIMVNTWLEIECGACLVAYTSLLLQ